MVREGGALRSIGWEEAEAMLTERIRGAAGNVLYIGGHSGPTMARLVEQFVGAVGGRRVQYDALSAAPLREAARIAFGIDAVPRYQIDQARFLVSFGDDFIDGGIAPLSQQRDFARMAAVDEHGSKGRLVYVGPRLSLTGQNADEWVPIRPGSEAAVALGMASVIAADRRRGRPVRLGVGCLRRRARPPRPRASTRTRSGSSPTSSRRARAWRWDRAWPAHHRGATAAHIAVLILNHVAGSFGRTIHMGGGPQTPARPYADMEAAIRSMAGGEVGVVMIHGANPAYSLPVASSFADAFGSVGFKVSFAQSPDETSAMADLILPDRHWLESWGDSVGRDGVMALRQPAMRPVPHFDAKQTGDVLLSVAARLGSTLGGATFYEYLRAAHQADAGAADFDGYWREALRTGVILRDVPEPGVPALRAPDTALSFDMPAFDGDGDLTLLVHPSPRFGAGELSNAPWMQELPDPVSKITWHSWLEMHPDAAEARGLREGDIVTVASPYGQVQVPLWPYPGLRPDTVALAMGGGHTDFGRWANDKGVNVMHLLPAEAEQPSGAFVTLATKVSVTPTGEHRRLAKVSGSDTQHDRPIAPAIALADLSEGAEPENEEEGLEELQAGGGFVPVPAEGGTPESFPLEGSRYGKYADRENRARWAMAIDLDKCTGCSACVTACQSENNVPWVGEQQVMMGREMHWIRIERYYEHVDATQAGDLDIRHLPMLCQHCNNAPCEPVCPVFATYHTPEGVNAQIYNRCVGTRYCANNCPYKVRVFNWYRFTDAVPEPMNWQWNPDVTVRDNGVMEKCSFCMQRVREAENRVALEKRGSIPDDGEVLMACQQSCPAEAIVWGNIRDPESRVSQVAQNQRTYRVLNEEINTQPAVNYLKKVTFHEVASGEHA